MVDLVAGGQSKAGVGGLSPSPCLAPFKPMLVLIENPQCPKCVWKVTLDKMAEVCAIGRGVDFCLSQNVFSHQTTWIWIILQMSNLFLIFWLAETLYCKSLRCQHEAFTNILAIIRHLYKLEVGTLPPPGQEVERAPAILTSFLTRTSLWGSDQEK